MILTALLLATCPLRIIDGDTIDYQCERIRVADIDAPEIRGLCEYERQLAIRARTRLQQLLGEGFVLVRSGRDRDRYGRQLRVVVDRRGNSIGDRLVREGLARTWEGRRRPWC